MFWMYSVEASWDHVGTLCTDWWGMLPASQMEACLADISIWIFRNRAKKNRSLLFSFQSAWIGLPSDRWKEYLRVDHDVVSLLTYISDDWEQINSTSKACYYHIHNIYIIRPYITTNGCKIVAQAPSRRNMEMLSCIIFHLQ